MHRKMKHLDCHAVLQNPTMDSNDFSKPQALTPVEKEANLRHLGRGWREVAVRLPPYSVVFVEVRPCVCDVVCGKQCSTT
jgi:hypothetical protein